MMTPFLAICGCSIASIDHFNKSYKCFFCFVIFEPP